MACFSWLHLTDLHCGQQEHSWLLPGVQDIFFEDIKRLYQKCGPWDLVLFTGDLTQKGTTEDFQAARGFLEQLWKCFETFDAPLPTLLTVPGNHDLVRPAKKTAAVRMLTENFSDIQEEFWDDTAEEGEEYRQIVTTAFEKYMTWWNAQPFRANTITSGLLPGDFSVTLEKEGARLGIVGLNTSFLQLTDDDYNRKLALHPLQFHRACDGNGAAWAKQHHACLLLTHHPPAWLSKTSRQNLYAEITVYGRFAVHLCGHNHEAAMQEHADGGTEFRRSWQGWSLFGLEYFTGKTGNFQRLHGYAAGRIELSGAKGTVSFWPRKASLQGGVQRKIVPDYENFELTDQHHTRPREFDLLQPYRVAETGEDLTGFQKPVRSDEPKEVTLPVALRQQITDFLTSLPNLHDSSAQRTLILSAGLEPQLHNQLTFGIPAAQFVELLVSTLKSYGRLGDGRDALEAILEAAKQYVGKDRQEYADTLIQALRDHKQAPTPPQQPDTPVEPPADVPDEPSVDVASLREAYLTRLLSQTSRLELAGIDRKAAGQDVEAYLNLGAIYTALLTLSAEHNIRDGAKMDSPLEGGQGGVFPSREGAGVGSDRRLSALDQLNQHNRLVLLGDPGSGKSTFVKFVAMCLAGELLGDSVTNLKLLTAPLPDEEGKDQEEPQHWQHEPLLPVWVILRDFAAKGLPSGGKPATAKHLWEFVVTTLKETPFGDYAPCLRQHLLETGGLILLDGLDEVPEAHARRAQIKQAVEDFASSFPKCRILVTSRTYAYQKQDWRLSGFVEAVLAPFTAGQIRRFVGLWYSHIAEVRGMDSDNAQGRAELLKRAIFGSERLYEFAERPLLLTLMASLHAWRGGSLPEKRGELYSEATDLLLDWWERAKMVTDADGQIIIAQPSLTELLNVGKDYVQKALNALAFQAHASQPDLVGTADIPEEKLVNELLTVSENKDLRPARLIEFLSDRAGLLVPQGNKIYTFPHRTFQEYLAACYLTEEESYPENVAALARRDPNRWREVVLLAGTRAAKIAPMIWTLAETLCYRNADDPHTTSEDAWGALLAGQALAETANLEQISPRNKPKAEKVRDWLVEILTECKPSGSPLPVVERATAGNILALLGDLRPGVGLREGGLPDIVWCEVPEGKFKMGSDPKKYKEAYDWEQPQHEVKVSTFQISRYPVTNTQYQAFVEDNGYIEKAYWTDEGWKWKEEEQLDKPEKYGGLFDLSNHPVVLVSWYEASAFCQWLTLRLREKGELADKQIIRLPSEAEWEKAARGEDGRIYPWGKSITPELANYSDTGLGSTSTVGCFPRGVSPYGCEDMSGNVLEWCLDTWHDNYKGAPSDGSAWLSGGSDRVYRGGSWYDSARYVRCAFRLDFLPGLRFHVLGFRLARTM